MEALPQLEGFSNPPHQRVLPRQQGTLKLVGMLPEDSHQNQSIDDDKDELHLTKVASSKVMPARRSFDVGDKTSNELSPPTVQKAVKKTLLGRMKKTVKGKLNHRGRSKSPVRQHSGETHSTHTASSY